MWSRTALGAITFRHRYNRGKHLIQISPIHLYEIEDFAVRAFVRAHTWQAQRLPRAQGRIRMTFQVSSYDN
jgi:hypothetical protein